MALILTLFSLQTIAAQDVVGEKLITKFEENLPEVITSITPPANPEDKISNQGQDALSEVAPQSEHPDPDTNKQDAYNISSEKPLGEVAAVAIENSPALVVCSDNPSLCFTPTPTPTLTPTPTPIETPIPQPEPTFIPCPPPPCPIIHGFPSDNPTAPLIYPCPEFPTGEKPQIVCPETY
ncbi:MAG: Filamentous hemagglutinin family outer membrane protein [Microgenomates group bacterium GW2011_GWC1_38_12]|nr:MAG: Filamentous hemagglutinin family outer membrane protein [Microgenomates group bacterium GW2011_GWC1_38_12]